MTETASIATLRLDKWLWFARVVRTRSLATRLCAAGSVTVGAHPAAKPHHLLRVSDVVTVEILQRRRRLIVRALGAHRGPPAEARLLYDEPTPPIALDQRAPAWTSLFAEDDEMLDDHAAV